MHQSGKGVAPEPVSGDNKLSSLEIAGVALSPTFNRNIYEYTATVEHSTESISINASTSDTKATATGLGVHSLKTGANKITIVVVAEDGSRQEYVITITRAENPTANELSPSALSVWSTAGNLHIKSDHDITAYVYTLTGILVKVETVHTGETTIPLSRGIYIVKTATKSIKVSIR